MNRILLILFCLFGFSSAAQAACASLAGKYLDGIWTVEIVEQHFPDVIKMTWTTPWSFVRPDRYVMDVKPDGKTPVMNVIRGIEGEPYWVFTHDGCELVSQWWSLVNGTLVKNAWIGIRIGKSDSGQLVMSYADPTGAWSWVYQPAPN